MTDKKQIPSNKPANQQAKPWTTQRALLLSIACLALGVGGGWLIRSLQGSTAKDRSTPAATPVAVAAPAPQAPGPESLKEMADTQAAPLVEKLKADPDNFDLLTGIGNLYYDAHVYPVAIGYYQRALKVKPSDANVRTDMGTAYWYTGNADAAIAAFNQALRAAPDNPNTLFNRGLVKWKGKSDATGAIADWQKLLSVNPSYAGKDQVNQMLAEAKGANPGNPAK